VNYSEICDAVELLQKKYGESNPFRLAQQMGIHILLSPLGTDTDAIKGFFLENKRIRTITINSDLPSVIQRIICAHELGHAVLHKSSGIHAFHEVALFDQTSVFEKDANIFAAEYLLDDEIVLDVLNQDNTFFTAAAELMVPAELLDFKFRVLKWRGYKIMEAPISSRHDFLRDMEVPQIDDDHIC